MEYDDSTVTDSSQVVTLVPDSELLIENLQRSKDFSRNILWGKEVIRAIDEEDIIRLIQVFKRKAYLGVNINQVVDENGYGGYCWTAWIHKFRGDTATHISIKQKKMYALSTLLILEPDLTILNDEGDSVNDLCLKILGKRVIDLKIDAYKKIMPRIHPKDFSKLDGCLNSYVVRNAQKEADHITFSGRQLYNEPPNDIITYYQSKGNTITKKEEISKINEDNNDFDVWGLKTIDDICDMIRMQAKRFNQLEHSKKVAESGLSLLSNLNETKVDSVKVLLQMLKKPLVANLHFMKSKQAKHIIAKKIEAQNGDEESEKANSEITKQKVDSAVRFITTLSTQTNLKYVNISTQGSEKLFRTLKDNLVIQKLILSRARLTDKSMECFSECLPTMKSLIHIDFSQNAITCEGVKILRDVFENYNLKYINVLNLSYNRIKRLGLEWALDIKKNLHASSKINLTGNKLKYEEDRKAIESIIDNMTTNIGVLVHMEKETIIYGDRDAALPIIVTDKYTFPTHIPTKSIG